MKKKRFNYKLVLLLLLVVLTKKINLYASNEYTIVIDTFKSTIIQNMVTGTVTDFEGNPLPGVNIIEKGTTNGTTTDFDGNFKLSANNDAILIFSYIGYTTLEEAVNNRNAINLSLNKGEQLDELIIVGSRNPKRTSVNSPVPVDVLDVAKIAASTGKVDVNDIIQFAAPSFNATKQSGSDGADHIVPASLRGLGPDQTLVLINGKRRHQSSLVNIFGTRGRGNSGTDLNAIPASAIKRIEILRDGASAQYGSDAIAGVINIVLKDATDGFSGGITYGAYSTAIGNGWAEETGETLYNVEGENRLDGKEKNYDGNTLQINTNYGLAIGKNGGYANFTTEFTSREKTLRPGFEWRKGYGSAAIEGFNFIVNSSIPVSDNTEIYAYGGRNFRDTDANAFSRGPADEDNRTVASLHPNGFTPRITSNIIDASVSAGIKHAMNNGWNLDFNNTYGKNNFHYFIKNTNNASLKNASPTDFDAGGHFLSQNTTSIDFNKFNENFGSGLSLAFGLEYRTENFGIFAGEEASYGAYDENGVLITNPAIQTPATNDNGDILDSGSQGFPGYSPENEINRSRTNYSIYFDTEYNFSDAFMIAGALRYETYSDFGETVNFKIASRYKVNDNLSFRGSISSGFRAPSLAQLHYNLRFNNIVAGASVPSLLSANNSTVTKAFGIGDLNQEKAINSSIGFTYKKGKFTATIDAYSISVDDRIILTDNFTDQSILGPLSVDAAQFFANGVDTQTSGLDLVFNYDFSITENSNLNLSLIGNINSLDIKNIKNNNLNEFTFFGPFSQAYLEAAAPDHKFGLNAIYTNSKFNAGLTLTKFSEVILQDFQWIDSPATTQAEADALLDIATDVYESAFTLDLNLGYQITDKIQITIGANNLFNIYPTAQFDGWTDQGGLADSVQMGSDGRYVFSRLNFSF